MKGNSMWQQRYYTVIDMYKNMQGSRGKHGEQHAAVSGGHHDIKQDGSNGKLRTMRAFAGTAPGTVMLAKNTKYGIRNGYVNKTEQYLKQSR